jgi:hypothetical protein
VRTHTADGSVTRMACATDDPFGGLSSDHSFEIIGTLRSGITLGVR